MTSSRRPARVCKISRVTGTLRKWPAGKHRATWMEKLAERQVCRTTCGWGGCAWSVEGKLPANLTKLERHREKKHPDFVPYKRPPRRRIGQR